MFGFLRARNVDHIYMYIYSSDSVISAYYQIKDELHARFMKQIFETVLVLFMFY
jgi:hypothetical protein